ncbi:unnamed protein product [Candidula unifasciata]|uniref:FUN14 domain-containing protein 1 n=1 Tax=Candidula unifasciata TaxID=100452 RepID=A0A8S3YHS5_9EUPU|nr:unnamed protein product [Candidula unifasciata]
MKEMQKKAQFTVAPSTSEPYKRPSASVKPNPPKIPEKKVEPPEVFDDSDEESLSEIESLDYSILEPQETGCYLESIRDFFLGDVTASSAFRQFAIGGVFGWISGYLAKKVGQLAAICVGGGLFLTQLAQYQGYIKVDWTKVKHCLTQQDAKVKNFVMKHRHSVQTFYEENFFMATGFTAGVAFAFSLIDIIMPI